MHYQAILFDLDGTLLPMDMEAFTQGYLSLLSARLAPYGVPAPRLVEGVWAGCAAMVHNDGTRTNEAVFWQVFTAHTGLTQAQADADCLDFYEREFHGARRLTGPNPLAVRAVQLARQKAGKVALATNPLFPRAGQLTRMGWVGLAAEDFDLVTSYENSTLCKPNAAYYTEVCRQLSVTPENCLMIGNDEREDMAAGSAAGLQGFLVTDCLIPWEGHPWQGPRGSFAQLVAFLQAL